MFSPNNQPVAKTAKCSVYSQGAVQDCLFLGVVVLLSLILYIHGLGFYSDDWYFLSRFSLSEDRSLGGLFQSAYYPWGRMRPVQILYLVGLYWLFDLHPFGYHLVNAAIFLSGIVLFYLVLRELEQGRVFALAVAAVYSLLPCYSEDRFWVASFQVNLSMTLYFLSLYSDLRALQSRLKCLWGWKLLSLLSLLGSTLAYEVFMPLFLLNPLLIWYRKGYNSAKQLSRAKLAVLFGINLPILILVAFFKVAVTTRLEKIEFKEHIIWFVRLIKQAIVVSYGHHGLFLPRTISKLLLDHPKGQFLVVGGLLGLLIAVYLYFVIRQSKTDLGSQGKMFSLIVWGLFIFGMGYAIFLTNKNAAIEIPNNRVTIAATVGVALSQVGVLGWVTNTFLSSDQFRKYGFCVLVAILCTGSFLINSAVASFWVAAYQQEQEVLADIRRHFSTLPTGATFILDGVCPSIGGIPVFESHYDLAGALQIAYHDPTLLADVVRPNLRVNDDGLHTSFHRDQLHYPYHKLLIYHFGRKTAYPLNDAEEARRYFQTSTPKDNRNVSH
jgi:hypothetical protein